MPFVSRFSALLDRLRPGHARPIQIDEDPWGDPGPLARMDVAALGGAGLHDGCLQQPPAHLR